MRTVNSSNSNVVVLANSQDCSVVAAHDALRGRLLAELIFVTRFFQAVDGYAGAMKRAAKPALAAAARAAETIESSIISITRGLSRCWHTQGVMPHQSVVGVRT